MVEVMVAILVLTVGLVALSSLATATLSGTESARFAGLAANLASEKLEDLNRWPYWDPNVYVASGSTAGSDFRCPGVCNLPGRYGDGELLRQRIHQ